MSALHRTPRLDLGLSELRFLCGMPTNRRWIEKDIGAEERCDSRGLRIPLVPADQYANVRELRLPNPEPARLLGDVADRVDAVVRRRVARDEVILLVEERIVGDVHLPIHAEERSVGVDDGGRIPVHATRLLLEDRNDENDAELLRHRLHRISRWSGNRLSDVETFALLRFTEVRRIEELFEAND